MPVSVREVFKCSNLYPSKNDKDRFFTDMSKKRYWTELSQFLIWFLWHVCEKAVLNFFLKGIILLGWVWRVYVRLCQLNVANKYYLYGVLCVVLLHCLDMFLLNKLCSNQGRLLSSGSSENKRTDKNKPNTVSRICVTWCAQTIAVTRGIASCLICSQDMTNCVVFRNPKTIRLTIQASDLYHGPCRL